MTTAIDVKATIAEAERLQQAARDERAKTAKALGIQPTK